MARLPPDLPVLRRDKDDPTIVRLDNLDLATFLFMRGVRVEVSAKVSRYRFSFVFSDPDRKADGLAREYVNSEFSRFAASQRTLKSMCAKFSAQRPEEASYERNRAGRGQQHH